MGVSLGAMSASISVDIASFTRNMAKVQADLEAFAKSAQHTSQTATSASKGSDQLAASNAKAGSSAKKAGTDTQSFGQALTSHIKTLGKLTTSIGLGIFAFKQISGGAEAAAQAILGPNAAMEQSTIAFTQLLHSGTAASKMLTNLQDFADKTPFEFPQLLDASKQLLAFGFSSTAIIPMLQNIGDAAAGLGLGQDGIDRITLALGQMQTKARVSSDEMGQLTEAGIPAWTLLAKGMGLSVAQVQQLSEQGKIASSTAIPILLKGMNSVFGGQMQAQAGTFNGIMSNLQDIWGTLSRDATKPIFDLAKQGLQSVATIISSPAFKQFATTLSNDIANGIKDVSTFTNNNIRPALQKLLDLVKLIKTDFGDSGVFGNFIGSLGNLLTALLPLANPMNGVAGKALLLATNGLTAKDVVNGLKDAMVAATDAVNSLGNGIKAVTGFFKDNSIQAELIKDAMIGISVAIWAIKIAQFVSTLPSMFISLVLWSMYAWDAVAANLALAASFLLANAPLILIGVGIALLVTGILLAIQHWGAISAWLMGVWSAFTAWFMSAMGAVGSWFQNLWGGISSWFQGIGADILGFFVGIGSGITSFFSGIGSSTGGFFSGIGANIVGFFVGIGSVIGGAFMSVVSTIGSVFSGAVSAVSGVLGAILGAIVGWIVGVVTAIVNNPFVNYFIQVFATINNIINALLLLALKIVVGFFVSMFNLAVIGIGWLVSSFFNGLTIIYTTVVSILTPIITFIVGFFVGVYNTAVLWLTTAYNFIASILSIVVGFISLKFNQALGFVTSVVSAIVAVVSTYFNMAKDKVFAVLVIIGSIVLNAWSGVRNTTMNIWNSVYGTIAGFVGGIYNAVASKVALVVGFVSAKFNQMKAEGMAIWAAFILIVTTKVAQFTSGVTDKFNNVKNNVMNVFTSLRDKVGGVIKGFIDNVITGLNKGIGAAENFVNSFGHALNWIADKLGTKGTIPDVHFGTIPMYAQGIGSHPGGPAIVGEVGRELSMANGKLSMLGANGPQMVNLARGASVLPHNQTEALLSSGAIPGYAGGIGDFFSWIGGGAKSVLSGIMGMFGLKNFSMPGQLTDIAGGVLGKVENMAMTWISNILPKFGGGGNANIPGSVESWIETAIAMTHVPGNWLSPLETIAMHESGGNPNAINNWDSNAKAGIPSQGLFQVIPPTFAAYALSGHNSILNPVDNAASAIEYILSRYGSVFNVPGIQSMANGGGYVGYANGGIISEQIAGIGLSSGKRYAFGENGPEAITPLSGVPGGGRSGRNANTGGGTSGPVTIILELNGRQMAKGTAPYMMDEMRLKLGTK